MHAHGRFESALAWMQALESGAQGIMDLNRGTPHSTRAHGEREYLIVARQLAGAVELADRCFAAHRAPRKGPETQRRDMLLERVRRATIAMKDLERWIASARCAGWYPERHAVQWPQCEPARQAWKRGPIEEPALKPLHEIGWRFDTIEDTYKAVHKAIMQVIAEQTPTQHSTVRLSLHPNKANDTCVEPGIIVVAAIDTESWLAGIMHAADVIEAKTNHMIPELCLGEIRVIEGGGGREMVYEVECERHEIATETIEVTAYNENQALERVAVRNIHETGHRPHPPQERPGARTGPRPRLWRRTRTCTTIGARRKPRSPPQHATLGIGHHEPVPRQATKQGALGLPDAAKDPLPSNTPLCGNQRIRFLRPASRAHPRSAHTASPRSTPRKVLRPSPQVQKPDAHDDPRTVEGRGRCACAARRGQP